MGYTFLQAVDLLAFHDAVDVAQPALVDWGFALPIPFSGASQPYGGYIHSLDKIISLKDASGGIRDPIAFPPLLVGAGFPDTRVGEDDSIYEPPMAFGDPFRTGGQLVYCSTTGGPATTWEQLNLTTMSKAGSPAFPTTPPGNGPIRIDFSLGAFSMSSTPGGWSAGAPFGFEGNAYGMLVFEGLTDGIAGQTNLTGTNVYPAGLALIRCAFGTVPAPIGTGVSNDDDNGWVWLDLNTGGLDGICFPDLPGVTSSSALEPNSEAPIAGHVFAWYAGQYIPDTDATFVAPKGRIIALTDGDDIPASSAFQQSVFVRFVEFNPLNIVNPNTPQRIHGRVLDFSSLDFDDTPMFTQGGAPTAGQRTWRAVFHPLTNRFLMVLGPTVATLPQVANESYLGSWSLAIDPAIVTSPVARDTPRTNDIIEFESLVTGTLNEPVSGQDIDWTLFRNSTEGEVLNASTFPGTSTVANPPIDDTSPSQPEGTLVVIADSVVLVEGVDYTVVLSTGVITWITDQSGAALVTATYEHRQTDATPAHGTLLISTSQSNSEGRVFTQVRYADNDALVGTLDRLRNVVA